MHKDPLHQKCNFRYSFALMLRGAKCAIQEHFLDIFFNYMKICSSQTRKYGGLAILTTELRITDLPLSTTENTEVSVFFKDGWQHCAARGWCLRHLLFVLLADTAVAEHDDNNQHEHHGHHNHHWQQTNRYTLVHTEN